MGGPLGAVGTSSLACHLLKVHFVSFRLHRQEEVLVDHSAVCGHPLLLLLCSANAYLFIVLPALQGGGGVGGPLGAAAAAAAPGAQEEVARLGGPRAADRLGRVSLVC